MKIENYHYQSWKECSRFILILRSEKIMNDDLSNLSFSWVVIKQTERIWSNEYALDIECMSFVIIDIQLLDEFDSVELVQFDKDHISWDNHHAEHY